MEAKSRPTTTSTSAAEKVKKALHALSSKKWRDIPRIKHAPSIHESSNTAAKRMACFRRVLSNSLLGRPIVLSVHSPCLRPQELLQLELSTVGGHTSRFRALNFEQIGHTSSAQVRESVRQENRHSERNSNRDDISRHATVDESEAFAIQKTANSGNWPLLSFEHLITDNVQWVGQRSPSDTGGHRFCSRTAEHLTPVLRRASGSGWRRQNRLHEVLDPDCCDVFRNRFKHAGTRPMPEPLSPPVTINVQQGCTKIRMLAVWILDGNCPANNRLIYYLHYRRNGNSRERVRYDNGEAAPPHHCLPRIRKIEDGSSGPCHPKHSSCHTLVRWTEKDSYSRIQTFGCMREPRLSNCCSLPQREIQDSSHARGRKIGYWIRVTSTAHDSNATACQRR
mmetsp:Transcript_49294/g.106769  ORF Transcript_49294/g.106769 Transcript_49294/m.106769 type:complete len:394 (-) Transcript_49294:121-1302(-)